MFTSTKIIIPLLILISLYCGNIYAQANDTVYYEVVKANTNANFSTGYVQLLSMDIEKYNFSLKTGFGANLQYNKFFIDLGWEYDYVDGIAGAQSINDSYNKKGFPATVDKNSRNGFVNLGFAILDVNKVSKVKVIVKSRRNTDYFIKAHAPVNHKLNLELGYKSGLTWYNLYNYTITARL